MVDGPEENILDFGADLVKGEDTFPAFLNFPSNAKYSLQFVRK